MTLADLYNTFKQKLYRDAMCLVRDPHRAEDLVQETFLRAMGHVELLNQLNDHQRHAWLHRTLKHLFLNEQKAHQQEQFLTKQLTMPTPFACHPLSKAVFQELLDHVPARYHELLHKRYVLGMNSQEIAQELGIPAATVRSRLHLAMKALRANKSRFL